MPWQPGATAYLLDELGRPCGPVRILSASRFPDKAGAYWYGVQAALAGGALYGYDQGSALVQTVDRVLSVPESRLAAVEEIPAAVRHELALQRRALERNG